jgi:NAD(P)-dependent dehydrogenase (short-subunit alcohol dehydrogenase family)
MASRSFWLPAPGDASDHEAVRSAVECTADRFGRLDAVVANAGFATHDDIADGDPAGWRQMVLTNVLGPALLINTALPALKATGGRIVLVGSVAGVVYTPGNVYGATKWAVTGLAENTRRLVTADGVGVTLVAPGRVETPFWGDAGVPDGLLLTAAQLAESISGRSAGRAASTSTPWWSGRSAGPCDGSGAAGERLDGAYYEVGLGEGGQDDVGAGAAQLRLGGVAGGDRDGPGTADLRGPHVVR